jgi:CRP/FNR family transcriptional regulator
MIKAPLETIRDLRVLPCLSGLRSEDLADLAQASAQKRYGRNQAIFQEQGEAKFFFIVTGGSVKLSKTSAGGRELVIRIMRPGDYFCCAPLFESGRYVVSALSLDDSTLVVIPGDAFKRIILGSVSGIGLKIIAGLCARVRYLSNLVEDLSFKDVEQRVMLALLRMAEEKAPEDMLVSLAVTHQDIAAITGSVREVVSRTMSRLRKEGIIIDSSAKGFLIDKESLAGLLHRKESVS